jgi:hypothetical protein
MLILEKISHGVYREHSEGFEMTAHVIERHSESFGETQD